MEKKYFMPNNHLFPLSAAEFDARIRFNTKYVSDNLTKWGIDPLKYEPVQTCTADWPVVYEKAMNRQTRSQVDVLARKERQKLITKVFGNFIRENVVNNPLVTDEDREALGITIRDTVRTPMPVPATIPVATIGISTPLQHIIRIKDSESAGTGKPKGVMGCEIFRKIGDEPPKNTSELSFIAVCTRNVYTVNYSFEERGLFVYYRMRWINTRGEQGPWSEIVNVIVP